MTLPQSPPTTSGIVVVTGSNSFDPQSSDFPIIRGLVASVGRTDLNIIGGGGEDFTSTLSGVAGTITSLGRKNINIIGGQVFSTEVSDLGLAGLLTIIGRSVGTEKPVTVPGHVLNVPNDIDITQTTTTTSGVVVMDMFIGAGAVFVVPIVGNERIFPLFQGVFPEQDRRIFPRLPQNSTLIPGD